VTPLDVLDGVPGLRLADRDWRALAAMRHPVKVALWLALMRPTEELEARAQQGVERLADGDTRSIPAIIRWAEAAVLKGMNGDMTAWALVADRVEGKIGTRKDEVDPEDERRRGDIQSVIEAVVVGLTNSRLAQPDDSMLDVTAITSMDTERQDSDTARRTELAEAAHRDQQDAQARGSTLVATNEEPEERDLTEPGEDRPA
jgi:hypothetical protein